MIIKRYFLKEFIRFFSIVIMTLSGIMMIAEFFDKADEFYSGKTDFITVIQYLLLLTPRFLVYSSPIASLVSILITLGIASRWREIIAIRASGGGLKRVLSFFFIISLLITISAFFINEAIVPASTKKAAWIRNVKILKLPRRIVYDKDIIWIKGIDGSIIRIGDFIEEKDSIINISIFNLDNDFKLTNRIEAKKAEWKGDRWLLEDVTIYETDSETTIRHNTLPTTTIDSPDIFKKEARAPDEMNIFELYHYYKRLERAGFNNIKYIIRFHEKLAYPMINFIMVLFSLSLSLNTRVGGTIWAIGIGIITIVLYWLLYSISISLGNTGTIPASVAPWVAPLFFTMTGTLLFLRVRE